MIMSIIQAKSRGDLAMHPGESRWREIGIMPSVGIEPRVGFSAYRAALDAGTFREPLVSCATESSANPAEIPTAQPDEDPAGLYILISMPE